MPSKIAVAAEVDRVITITTQEWASYQMEVGLQNEGYAIKAFI